MTIARRTPASEMDTIRDRFDRLFSDLTSWPRIITDSDFIPVDMRETDNEIIVKASMPGFKPEDISVDINRGVLTIDAETQQTSEEKEGTWHIRERRIGSVHRAITLPSPVQEDQVQAKYENGVLTVTLPKSEKSQPRRIQVQGS